VPVLFPQFADTGLLPKHGMARTAQWQPEGDAAYTLHIAAKSYPAWPHACALRIGMHTGPGQLCITLSVRNTGTSTWAWTGGLHPFFAVDDLTRCSLTGLAGVPVQDRYHPAAPHQTAALTWTDAPCERLYAKAPELRLQNGGRTLHLRTTGFTQWMVWNPGTAGAQTLPDLPDDDWRKFVCIEPVCVAQPVVLAPGEVFEGALQVRLG
jgi:glucose-6-phosphate 1-epimerase